MKPRGATSRIYVRRLLLIQVVMFAACGPLIYKSLFVDQIFADQILNAYQTAKTDSCRDAEIVFLGDSSLGNAIDANLFSALSGQKSVNLALTARYGYAGGYNLLRRIASGNLPKHVVLVYTLDTLSRDPAYDGFIYTMRNAFDFIELSNREKADVLDAAVNVFLSPSNLVRIIDRYILGKRVVAVANVPYTQNDYIRQGQPKDLSQLAIRPLNNRINAEKTRFLEKIGAFCQDRSINLVYLHGPLLEPVLDISGAYIANTNATLEKLGIHHLDTVLPIPPEKLGDSTDHVLPKYKDEYTRKYFALFQSLLAAPRPGMAAVR